MPEESKIDQIAKVVKQMADVVEDSTKTMGEIKEQTDKMGEDLITLQRRVDEFQTITEQRFEKLTEEQEEEQRKIWDVALKNTKLFKLWSYDDPITKALYRPRTTYNARKGCYELKGSYDGLEDLMMLNDALFIMGWLKADKTRNYAGYADYVKGFDTYQLAKYELERVPELRKALNTSDGSDWVPTALSAQIIDDLRLQLKVAALFEQIQVPTNSGSSYEVPLRGSRRRAYLMGESTDDSSNKISTATPPTSKLTFTVVKHALRMLASYEMTEDSIVPIIPLMREEIVQALADAEEDAILNGDTSSSHFDTGLSLGSDDIRKSWYGLRYYSNATNGNARVDISTLNVSNLRAIRKAMGRFGADPRQLAWITSISGYIQMMGLTEVLTLDKYGNNFTARAGELGMFDGASIIVSEFVSEELNTSGVYDGSTTTDTVILLVNHRAFKRAQKGQMISESERDIEVQQNKIVMSRRVDFKRSWTPGDNEDVVGIGYSLTS